MSDHKARPLWAPDFDVYLQSSEGRPTLLAHVDDNAKLVWNPEGFEILGFGSGEAANDSYSKCRRQWGCPEDPEEFMQD